MKGIDLAFRPRPFTISEDYRDKLICQILPDEEVCTFHVLVRDHVVEVQASLDVHSSAYAVHLPSALGCAGLAKSGYLSLLSLSN